MRILDATCGARTIWYQKNHPFVTFLDRRKEKITTFKAGYKLRTRRTINIKPDIVAEWQNLPFKAESFDMVVFDPPHIIEKTITKTTKLKMHYGYFLESNYKQILKEGIKDLFRVLKPNGILTFKWSENSKKSDDIIPLFPYQQLFGTRTGQANKNH